MALFESQLPYMYATDEDYFKTSEQVALSITPCKYVGDNTKKCSSEKEIGNFFSKHDLRLQVKQVDDRGSAYYEEVKLPRQGDAVSLFIREVTTIDEDLFYLLGNVMSRWFGSGN